MWKKSFVCVTSLLASACQEAPSAPESVANTRLRQSLTPTAQGSVFPGAFYNFEVVGMSGNGQVGAAGQYPVLGEGPSINDQGRIAFTGTKVANGKSIFLDSGSSPLSLTGDPLERYSDFPRINSEGRVACQQADTHYGMGVYVWSAPDTFTHVIYNQGAQPTDFYPLSNIVAFNDSGQIAMSSIDGEVGTRTSSSAPLYRRNTDFSPPSIAMDNAGRALFFDLDFSSNNDPRTLRLAPNDLSSVTTIANSDCFSAIGDFPGISPDGRIIVFYGESNGTCALSPQADTAEGIFASLDLGGSTRTLVRLSGMKVEDPTSTTGNQDGTCDAGETCVSGELGFNAQGSPFTFASYQSNSRIGVAHQEKGAARLDGDSFVFTLVGAPNAAYPGHFSAQNGIWTARADVSLVGSALKLTLATPVPVLQKGDALGDQVVDHFGSTYYSYPDIANARTNRTGTPRQQAVGDHRLAFFVGATSGESLIVRAEHVTNPTGTVQGSSFQGRNHALEVLAMSGNGEVRAANQYSVLGEGPSINDQGRVAFTGDKVLNGESIFLDSGSNPWHLTPSVYLRFSGFPRINSAAHVACLQRESYDTSLRIWSAPDTATTMIDSQDISSDIYYLWNFVGFNDSDQMAFSTMNAKVGTRASPTTTVYQRSTFVPTDSITLDNAGNTLFFDMDPSTYSSALVLAPHDLSTTTVIADDNCFSAIGDLPGISPDGRIIVFYGESNGTCALSPEADTAEGIFASLDLGGPTRTLVRLSGMKVEDPTSTTGNQDGTCDAGETCVSGELGFNAQGSPFTFASYQSDARIGVAHQEKGAAGLDGDSFVFTLVGAPNAAHTGHFSAQNGIWTARADVSLVGSALKLTLATPLSVLQKGDSLGNQVIAHFGSTYYSYPDIANARTSTFGQPRQQAAGDHRLVFYAATTNNQEVIVRAEHL